MTNFIKDYTKRLVDTIISDDHTNIPKLCEHIDVILDGGMFNGSYLVGALLFLQELERRDKIKMERFSCCSIGSLVGLLYFMDALDMIDDLYKNTHETFKKTHQLSVIKELPKLLRNRMPKDICDKVKNRLYITYYSLEPSVEKIFVCEYETPEHLIDCVIRSCFMPFIVDGNLDYSGGVREKQQRVGNVPEHPAYLDGINAQLFDNEHTTKRKTLHLELFGLDKLTYSLNIKNENSNSHRIVSGLIDIYTFYLKQSATFMCSYVSDWTKTQRISYCVKLAIEYIIVFLVIVIKRAYKTQLITELMKLTKDSVIGDIFFAIVRDVYDIIISRYYC